MSLRYCIPLLAMLGLASCSTEHWLRSRPKSDDVQTINTAAGSRWVYVTTSDSTVYKGTHFTMTDSSITLLTGGSEFGW